MRTSFCIKTNNNEILDYLQQEIANISLPNIYFSQNKFKIYSNVIVHYIGTEKISFLTYMSNILTSCILSFFENTLISKIINYNYFYFDNYEKKIIKEICSNSLNTTSSDFFNRHEDIFSSVFNYLTDNKSIVLDGFVNFRLYNYQKSLDSAIDLSVNKFIIDREYNDFINLLKIYIDSKEPTIDLVHLIYTENTPILLDENKEIIDLSCNTIINATYLSDITFSSADYILNTLLTIVPKKIVLHLISAEDDFINSLKLIFSNKLVICNDCDICKTYTLLTQM